MASWECFKSALYAVGFCLMLLFVIPIHIDKKTETSTKARAKFSSYVKQFNKPYSEDSEDYTARLAVFENALVTIDTLNTNRESNESALYGLTEYADLSHNEFKNKFLKKHHHDHHRSKASHNGHHSTIKRAVMSEVPLKVDWRANGVVTGVKDQGPCGACWAFSTVSAVESMLAIKTGKLMDLSVQEMIDCARNGNLGCEGGDFCSLLEWITSYNITIAPTPAYPLVLKNDVCKWNKATAGVMVARNFTCDYLVGDEHSILEQLAKHGPVVVAVNALSWQYYLGGVVQNNCLGDPEFLNHAVEIVGYDLSAAIPHYIAKNSWGTRFGEKGYIRIATGNNVCGIASEVTSLDVL